MSYGKKDEDADSALVKIDRTQVFQEGKQAPAARATAQTRPASRRHSGGSS
jgi:hypothetical protein